MAEVVQANVHVQNCQQNREARRQETQLTWNAMEVEARIIFAETMRTKEKIEANLIWRDLRNVVARAHLDLDWDWSFANLKIGAILGGLVNDPRNFDAVTKPVSLKPQPAIAFAAERGMRTALEHLKPLELD